MKRLFAKLEKIIKRMRWKALFFLKDDNEKYDSLVNEVEFYKKEEMYGFKSFRKPPQIKEMEQFEKDFYDIVKTII